MNMVATETGHALDVNAVFETASTVVGAAVPTATLSPLEPSDSTPTGAAVLLATGAEGGAVSVMIDGRSDSDDFDISGVLTALAEQLTDTYALVPVEEGAESNSELAAATTFRASVTDEDAVVGELYLTVAGGTTDADESPEETEAESAVPEEGADDEAERTTAEAAPDPEAEIETSTEPTPSTTVPDASLAERLPNLAAVDMSVAVELGRVRLPIRELLGLGNGSVIRLGTPVGESFDILVNGKPAARGDLVVVGGRLAVRIRELLGIEA